MLPGFHVSIRVSVKLHALASVCLWTFVFASIPLFCQTQSTPSTVPRPPASLTQPASAGVAHPPGAAKQQPANADDQPNTTFKVNVKLVNVFATVTNVGGAPVSAL